MSSAAIVISAIRVKANPRWPLLPNEQNMKITRCIFYGNLTTTLVHEIRASSRAAEDRTRYKGVVVKSSVVPQRPCKVVG